MEDIIKMILQQIIQDKIVKNLLMFFGMFMIISGAYMAIDLHTNSEYQEAKKVLEQDERYSKIVSFGENLMIGGYVTLLIGGGIITVCGYVLRGCY